MSILAIVYYVFAKNKKKLKISEKSCFKPLKYYILQQINLARFEYFKI